MMRFLPLLLLLTLIPLAGCERSPAPLAGGAVILAFGDGLTAGSGGATPGGFPAALERQLGRKVINAGVPGESTAEGLQRLPGVLAETRPALVIFCHGGDDMSREVDALQLIDNLKAMVKLIKESQAEVFIVAVPPPAAFFQPAAFYNQIARDLEVSIEVNALSNILSRKELHSEGIYPNDQGYAALAEALAKRLQAKGR